VLVLVNGKRRHNAALNDLSTSTDSGANPVDLDLIRFPRSRGSRCSPMALPRNTVPTRSAG
jgi:hypothetical protein